MGSHAPASRMTPRGASLGRLPRGPRPRASALQSAAAPKWYETCGETVQGQRSYVEHDVYGHETPSSGGVVVPARAALSDTGQGGGERELRPGRHRLRGEKGAQLVGIVALGDLAVHPGNRPVAAGVLEQVSESGESGRTWLTAHG